MNKTLILTLALFLLSLAGPAPAAPLFKWTDGDGVVHFSDQPDPARDAERIAMPRSPVPKAPAESAPAQQQAAADDATAAGGDEAQAQQQREIRAANCDIARRTFEHNSGIDRMYRLDANGERVFLSDEERESLLEKSRADVGHWCD